MPSGCDSSNYSKEHDDCKRHDFKNKNLHILHLDINSLLLKIDKMSFIAKESGINEPKIYSYILKRELHIVGYDVIRMNHFTRRGRDSCHIKTRHLTIISQVFVFTLRPRSYSFFPQIKTNFDRHVILTT